MKLESVDGLNTVADGVSAIIFDDLSGKKGLLTTQFNIGKNAQLTYFRLGALKENDAIQHELEFVLNRDARLKFYDLHPSQGEFLAKSRVLLEGDGASFDYFGIDELLGHANNNHDLLICHKGKATESRQEVRGVYSDNASGNLRSKVILERFAKGAKAHQIYHAIITDDDAMAKVEPQMEVYEDDVQASHGASIGRLDDNALFYLRSRGIALEEAKNMLLSAHFLAALKNIENASLRNTVSSHFSSINQDQFNESQI